MKKAVTLILIMILTILACRVTSAPARAGESGDSSAKPDKTTPVLLRFLVVPSQTAALIDYVKVVDEKKAVIAILDVGAPDDQSGENHVKVDNENRWGSSAAVDNCSVRPVNEGSARSEQSQFQMMLPCLPAARDLTIVVRYKDTGDDLLPVEIFNGEEFRRIGQILLENSGEWLVEEFTIPHLEIR